ncbi:exopolysaccharide biosynthesis GT4 family glycosyltransferase EpsE [Gynuella sp.]|uniref:exopolysaccharide biosynthesis GT4 family glycosyltransferase EpsE n=1 Tax=Gynuella sp. TaxID=2969146 RepID=UPI003D125EC9
MKKLGIFIPEFPGQTHAFFMRELAEINKKNVVTQIISTRAPKSGIGLARHAWASEAAEKTKYLFPLTAGELLKAVGHVLFAGPRRWFRLLKSVINSDLTLKEQLRQILYIILGAELKAFAQQNGIAHIHVHSCANTANIAMYSRLLGGPSYSMTLHGPLHDYGKNQHNKWKNAAFGIIITNDLLKEIHRLIPAEILPELRIAPMGVDVEKFNRSQEYRPPQKNELIKIVSCGRINKIKGHDDLIRVVATLVQREGLDVQLDICGSTDSNSNASGYLDELQQLCDSLNVSDRVNFLGSVSEEVVINKLQEAHFFCLASHKEPLGVAIMEALSMQTPTIVTRSPGTMEMIESDVDGILVEPKNPDGFVDAILALLDAPVQLTELSRQGRLTVIDRFHSGLSAEIIVNMANLS